MAAVRSRRQQLANDLQTHLKADEALQRTIVKIGRDALPLRFARLLGVIAVEHRLPRAVRQPLFQILALDGQHASQNPRRDERRAQHLRRMQRRNHVQQRDGRHRHHHRLPPGMQHHRHQQHVGVEYGADPVAVRRAADGRDEKEDEVHDQREGRISGILQAPPEQRHAGVNDVDREQDRRCRSSTRLEEMSCVARQLIASRMRMRLSSRRQDVGSIGLENSARAA